MDLRNEGRGASQSLDGAPSTKRQHDIEHARADRLTGKRSPSGVYQQTGFDPLLLRIGSQSRFRCVVCEVFNRFKAISQPGKKILETLIFEVFVYGVGLVLEFVGEIGPPHRREI